MFYFLNKNLNLIFFIFLFLFLFSRLHSEHLNFNLIVRVYFFNLFTIFLLVYYLFKNNYLKIIKESYNFTTLKILSYYFLFYIFYILLIDLKEIDHNFLYAPLIKGLMINLTFYITFLVFLVFLSKNYKNKNIFFAALCLSYIVELFLFPSEQSIDDFWQFSSYIGFTYIIFFLLNKINIHIAFIATILINLILGSYSLLITLMLSYSIIIFSNFSSKRNFLFFIFILFISTFTSLFLVFEGTKIKSSQYAYISETTSTSFINNKLFKILDRELINFKNKQIQDSSGLINIRQNENQIYCKDYVFDNSLVDNRHVRFFIRTRPEFFTSFVCFYNKPFGFGSAFSDYYNPNDLDTVNSHSHLMQSAIQAGIIGFVFWILIILIIICNLYISWSKNRLNNHQLIIGLYLIYDILFSPFLGNHIFLTGFLLAFFLSSQKNKIANY